MSQYLGDISAYALAVSQGYTGTEEEYAELMASYATVGQTAVTAAQTATTKASEAATSATTATNKASEATTAAQTATTKAAEASTSASTATSAKDTAVSASQTATTKASEATTAAATATSAKTDAVAANTAAQSAKTAAQTAQTGAETAAASVQSSAAQIQTNADDISELKEDLTHAFPHDTVSGAVASFTDGADDVPMDSVIVSIEPVQEGSGYPSPTNVRPISGWSEVNVQRTGKNLFDGTLLNGYYDANNGGVFVSSGNWKATNKMRCKSSTTYVMSGTSYPGGSYNGRSLFWDMNGNYLGARETGANFTSYANSAYMALYFGITYVTDAIQIEEGTTATTYEPYSGQSITIALGQTVYGGTLDVTKGELVIDMAMADMGDLIWTYNTSQAVFISGSIKTVMGRGTKIVCSTYKMTDNLQESVLVSLDKVIGCNKAPTQITGNFQYGVIVVKDTAYTDETAFKTAVTGQTLVYELATPVIVQLTPHEVTALLGSNNIWADSGDSEVTYRADPTLYIQRLTEPDADMVADANITSGQYFMVGNTLYKATANIASGGAITPNVNCTRKSLSEALNELNA